MSKKWSYTNQDININIMFWENREYFRFYIPFGTLYINYSSVLIKNALHVCWVCIIYGCHEKNTLKQSLLGKAEWNYFRGQVPEVLKIFLDTQMIKSDWIWWFFLILFKKKRKRMVGDIFHASFRLRGSFYVYWGKELLKKIGHLVS